MAHSKRFQTNPNCMLRTIAGESVLVPIGTETAISGGMATLTETAAFLWRFFSEPRTISEAIAAAKEEYNDPDNMIEQQVIYFVFTHVQVGLMMEATTNVNEKELDFSGDNP